MKNEILNKANETKESIDRIDAAISYIRLFRGSPEKPSLYIRLPNQGTIVIPHELTDHILGLIENKKEEELKDLQKQFDEL